MQEKLFDCMVSKFEYLDFNDTKVLDCFHCAYQYMEENEPDMLDNENMVGMELEYHFLRYLMREAKQGNDMIKDALLFGLEKNHDFFLRKRKDLVASVKKEDQYALYSLAFDRTVATYVDESVSKKLMDCIMTTYKQYVIEGKSMDELKDIIASEKVPLPVEVKKQEEKVELAPTKVEVSSSKVGKRKKKKEKKRRERLEKQALKEENSFKEEIILKEEPPLVEEKKEEPIELPKGTPSMQPSFFLEDYFINHFEEENLEEKLTVLLQLPNVKRLKGYLFAKKLYGETLFEKKKNVTLTSNQRSQVKGFIRGIQSLLEEEKLFEDVSFLSLEPVEEEFTEMIPEEEEEVIEELFPDFEEEEKETYATTFDTVLFSLIDLEYSLPEIQALLRIDDTILMSRLLAYFDEIDNQEDIIAYLLEHTPEKIKELLETEYFASFISALTEKEQEVIYLKLQAVSNPLLTDQVIAQITQLEEDEIKNYTIYTKDEKLQQLNPYVKKGGV